jgi:drug/metabolite transporter (DMT)-like permease
MVAVMAGPLLGEWPGRHRYAAIITGFCGVLVVTRPGGDMHWAVLVALATAVANAAYALITRMLAGRDRPRTTLFYSGLVGALVVIPVLPVVWAMPPGRVWAAVVGMGVLATLGHYLLIQANERTAASVLAPFSYTQLVGATLLGWVVFGDVPDRFTLLGGLVIGLSGITMLLQERRLRRRAADAGARRSR